MLGWIPFLGPIIEGVVSIFTKYRDTDLEKYKTKIGADVEEAKVSSNIISATKDDIGLRLMRDAVCLPVVAWSCIVGWDTIVAVRYPWLMFHVEKYPDSVGYLPYAVLVFLLGNIGINTWKRK